MRLTFASALLVACGASAAALPAPPLAPALPLSAFDTSDFKPLTLEDALKGINLNLPKVKINAVSAAAAATCSNPRIRYEWDSLGAADRMAYINAIQCLMAKPSAGGFGASRNRYEDLVSLHQSLTPNVHNNAKFLVWHRYYTWTFEDILRTECGYTKGIPWFDETKYAGRFGASSIFSNDYFGAINIGGNCVTNGKFANLGLNVGPGTGNTPHCLARAGDDSVTANGNSDLFNACYQRTTYSSMGGCLEGAHAWGHNGVGAVMRDMYASPGDPVFFLHHAFVDRQFRIWQNANSARVGTIDGTDRVGNPLTLDTTISVNGLRPTVTIRDVIDTMGTSMCYRYNY